MNEAAGFSDGESVEDRAFDYARTVALSDGVFAIALTLLVLNIGVPVLAHGHHGRLGHDLLQRRDEFTSYAIGFAVIALLWVRHHSFFRGLAWIDVRITVLNLATLAFVAFLPYPTRVLGLYGDEPASVVLYAATVAIVSLLAAAMRVYAMRGGMLTESGVRTVSRREHWAITPAVFLISIPIAYLSPTWAELSWLLLILPGLRRRRSAPSAGD